MRNFDLLREAKSLPARHLRQGSYLYRVGDPCDGNIYVLFEGELVEVDQNETFKPNGSAKIGELVGDIEVMSHCPRRLQSWKARSERVALAVIDRRAVESLGSLHPEFFIILLKSAIDNLTRAERELIERGKAGG